MSKSAMDDLSSLSQAKDLSIVSLDPEKRLEQSPALSRTGSRPSLRAASGGFMALFGCAGKRK